VTVQILYRASRAGILTGILLGIARISGETAPLLFTALSNPGRTTDMSSPMASLPVVIYNFAGSPYADWQNLAWAGALLITFSVLTLNIIARSFAPKTRN
jgi:phosphate transport system permease protein